MMASVKNFKILTQTILRMIARKTCIYSTISFAVLGFALPASAQFASNSKAPVDLVADEIQNQGNVTTLSGQVDMRQGDVRVLADQVKIYGVQAGGSTGNVSRVIANGNFYYITPDQEVRGDQGVYERSTETFTVTGNVILLQGEDNIVTGNTLFYNVESQDARMVGTCKGRKCGSTGRVKALLKSSGTNTNGQT